MNINEELQSAILNMSALDNFNDLYAIFQQSVVSCLNSVENCFIYIRNYNTDVFENVHLNPSILPENGIFRHVFDKHCSVILNEIEPSDPAFRLFDQNIDSNLQYIISPIINAKTGWLIAVYMITIRNPLNDHIQLLSFIEKQFTACYIRLECQNSIYCRNSILQLCADLYNQDSIVLQKKIIAHLIKETNCETGFLLLVDRINEEYYCQVISDKILEHQIRIPISSNFVQSRKSSTDISFFDMPEFSFFKENLKLKIDSCFSMAIVSHADDKPLAFVCLINKPNGFKKNDSDKVSECFKYISLILHMAVTIESEKLVKHQTQVLLQISRNLFAHLGNINELLKEIMCEARKLIKAERCSLFLLDSSTDELVAKVFDGDSTPLADGKDVRIPLTHGIAGHVATTGNILNIDDAYKHDLFYRAIDDETGFVTRNILCLPIKDESGSVIGVAQLCNKINGHRFTNFDVEIAQAFSIFCCISIVQCLLYKKLKESQDRSKLSNELMIYHMKVNLEDVVLLASHERRLITDFNYNINKFSCISRDISPDDMPKTLIIMFHDLGFIKRFHIKIDTLARFILMVKKGYRSPPYHNWTHAFAVTHFCYLLFINTNVRSLISEVEALALFVSCLCHDIDHRGTTNSFQIASGTILAALYSSGGSVLERHHFAQSLCILNTENCNVFENLESTEYRQALDLMHSIILSTDLAHHVSKLPALNKMAAEGYDSRKDSDHILLLSLIMTSCDLSDQTKSFENSKTIAERIYMEFFTQGDLEKAVGLNPTDNMDRDKAVIPDLQINFLNSIAVPVYALLSSIFPSTKDVYDAVLQNLDMWYNLNKLLIEKNLPRNMAMFDLDFASLIGPNFISADKAILT